MNMNTDERIQKLPDWIRKIIFFLKKVRVPAKLVYISVSVFATIWFLFRVIPKPSRAAYPCMQVVAPIMSGFVIWVLSLTGAAFAFQKVKLKFIEAKYFAAALFLFLGVGAISVFMVKSSNDLNAKDLKIWYKPNMPLGEAKGIFPGRVVWGRNPKIASWDEKTGMWWEDRFNNQEETDKLFSQSLFGLTKTKSDKKAWDKLFHFYNKTKRNSDAGYKAGEKIAIKINLNNTDSHISSPEINANPATVLSLLKSLINEAGIPQENITLGDPSRYLTDNIYNKCHANFPNVHYVDHVGGDGREKATFVPNGFLYSFDFDHQTHGLATCFAEATYVIDFAIMKGHVSQGVTLVAKNLFGCTDIETDWRRNAHSSGFSQNREGKRQYSVYPDFIGHKDLGAKTILYLVDGIYSNKLLNGIPNTKWTLAPFNNEWMGSLFVSQDPVAIESVVLDFALAAWPDAPDMMYSDHAMEEMALANNPPSGVKYDPERDGTPLASLGTAEHWNNPVDKKYSRNLGKDKGIELVYSLIKK